MRILAVVLVAGACTCPPKAQESTTPPPPPPATAPATQPAATPARRPAVDRASPVWRRVEGDSLKNDCTSDAQCFVGGCSGEVCSAEEGVNTTCEMPADGWPTKGAACACHGGQCLWMTTAPAP
jgi:eight-cysteine-cluster-containing protein